MVGISLYFVSIYGFYFTDKLAWPHDWLAWWIFSIWWQMWSFSIVEHKFQMGTTDKSLVRYRGERRHGENPNHRHDHYCDWIMRYAERANFFLDFYEWYMHCINCRSAHTSRETITNENHANFAHTDTNFCVNRKTLRSWSTEMMIKPNNFWQLYFQRCFGMHKLPS